MRQNIEAGAGDDPRRQAVSGFRIDDGQGRAQVFRGNTGLDLAFLEVDDGDAGRFAAGARRRRAGDMRL